MMGTFQLRLCDFFDGIFLRLIFGRVQSSDGPKLQLFTEQTRRTPPPQSRWRNGSCPDCYHEHEGPEECGFYLGEGKFCKCPTKRVA
jgi:hypothetical protein